MSACTVAEAVKLRTMLQDRILDGVRRFEADTGLRVDGVELRHNFTVGEERRTVAVALTVTIPSSASGPLG